VRAAPVHAAAATAFREQLIGAPRARLQARLDRSLRSGDKQSVACGAASPRRQRRSEPRQDIGELIIRPRPAHVSAHAQLALAQQPTILRQQHPLTGVGLVDQYLVSCVVGVCSVDADQPQPPRQRAEVNVQDEPGNAGPLRPIDRIHLDEVATGGAVAGDGRLPVDRHGADLGQWHAEGFHDVPE
jgi:hypothetical protein